jgi:Domain of unknown function (DUF5753)
VGRLPGLLQTEEYARWVITSSCSDEEAREIVALRMQRQACTPLDRRHFIIDEAVMLRIPAELRPSQQACLLEHAESGIDIRVPLLREWSLGEAFHLLELETGGGLLHLERYLADVNITDLNVITAYRGLFDRLHAASVDIREYL